MRPIRGRESTPIPKTFSKKSAVTPPISASESKPISLAVAVSERDGIQRVRPAIFAPESSSYVRGQEKNRRSSNKLHLLRSSRSKPLFDIRTCTEQRDVTLETTIDQALIRGLDTAFRVPSRGWSRV